MEKNVAMNQSLKLKVTVAYQIRAQAWEMLK